MAWIVLFIRTLLLPLNAINSSLIAKDLNVSMWLYHAGHGDKQREKIDTFRYILLGYFS